MTNPVKTVLITGAYRGIGKAAAKHFAEHGWHVVITARDLAKAQATVDEIITAGGKAEAMALDVSNPASIADAAKKFGQTHSHLDAIVNNAGIWLHGEHNILEATAEDIQQSLQTNAIGALEVVKGFLPLLKASDAARIVNVSSAAGSMTETASEQSPYAYFDTASYRLSKAALNSITAMLAKTLRADGIKVNAMCPGWTQTDMGGPDAPNTPEQAAALAYKLATLAADGPTGGFFNEQGALLW